MAQQIGSRGGDGGGTESDVLDVAIIGAGFSGLCMAIHLRKAGWNNFRLFEKSGGISGTWWDNTYPGAACDIPSHLYCFSFELNPDWSRVYAPQPEIQAYAERCADTYGLRPHIRFHTEIRSARFDDGRGLWHLETTEGQRITARFVVSGVGGLSRPNIPDIPGLKDFHGTVFHSARWDHAHDLTNRRVAVIGSAASAIQIVPQIAPRVAHLALFQRTPNYIVPRRDRAYTEREKALFRAVPLVMRLRRWAIFWRLNMNFSAFHTGTFMARRATKLALTHMRRQVADSSLWPKLIPDYPIGCKRILISDDFYPALNRDNVELVTEGIDHISSRGIVTRDGRARAFDTLILATGFRAFDFLDAFDIAGAGGRRLRDVWRRSMQAHRGVCVPGFPNLFFLVGPNTGLGHNSIIYMIEQQVGYVMKCLKKLRPGECLDVRPDAMRRYNARLQQGFAGTVWQEGCQSWYKLPDGRIPTLWPYNTVRYWRWMRRPDFREYAIIRPG